MANTRWTRNRSSKKKKDPDPDSTTPPDDDDDDKLAVWDLRFRRAKALQAERENLVQDRKLVSSASAVAQTADIINYIWLTCQALTTSLPLRLVGLDAEAIRREIVSDLSACSNKVQAHLDTLEEKLTAAPEKSTRGRKRG